MYTDSYALWEYYPKFLRPNEIQHPLKIVKEFFSTDRLDGHAEQLKEWRDLVIDKSNINTQPVSPSSLLFQYHINLRLLEVMYLLYIQNSKSYPKNELPVYDQLDKELKDWGLPCNLTKEETDNPYLILANIFDKYSLPRYREFFEAWLYDALSTKNGGDNLPPAEIVHVYENQLLLYSAAWLIHKRSEDSTVLHKNQGLKIGEVSGIESMPEGIDITLSTPVKDIGPKLSLAEKLGLEEVVSLIKEKVHCIRSITLLGLHRKPFTYYFAIIIDKDSNVAEHVIGNKIEDICRPLISVIVLVRKADGVKQSMLSGSRFWNNTMSKGSVAYIAPKFVLPAFNNVTPGIIKEQIKANWERWGVQGHEFFKGAEFYMSIANYQLAVFLMHQATESVLIASIKILSGHRFSAHNLKRMINITLLYTNELKDVFGFNSEEDNKLFNVLQTAYSEARYFDQFIADEESIKLLMPKVNLFLRKAQAIYVHLINSL